MAGGWQQAAGCQSAVIELPPAVSGQLADIGRGSGLVRGEQGLFRQTAGLATMERILAGVYPEIGSQTMTVSELLVQLRALGLPVVAEEDRENDRPVEPREVALPFPQKQLWQRLQIGLQKQDLCLELNADSAKILPREMTSDPASFLVLVYDVSPLVGGTPVEQLGWLVQAAVDPDEWAENGNGERQIIPYRLGNRQLLVITAPWSGHVKTRTLLAELHALSGGSVAGMTRSNLPEGAGIKDGSTPVELPLRPVPRSSMIREFQPRQPDEIRGLGGGMGGGGM